MTLVAYGLKYIISVMSLGIIKKIFMTNLMTIFKLCKLPETIFIESSWELLND